MLERSLSTGAALAKFREVVAAQGGDTRVVDDAGRLPQARLRRPLASPSAGFVTQVDAMGVALAALRLGGGRAKAEDAIDPAVGVAGLLKVGTPVKPGDTLCIVHANNERHAAEAADILQKAIVVGDAPGAPVPLVGEVIG
jgi:pyrimidine-nucleoside phosphorylase